jgi:hypothetical protein
MHELRTVLAFTLLVGAAAAGVLAACERDSGNSGWSDTIPTPAATVPTMPTSTSTIDGAPLPGDSGGGEGGDAAVGGLVSCKAVKAAVPSAVSGLYTIDPDGAEGPLPPLSVYCDMEFDNGGWTLIQSFTGQDSPQLLGNGDVGDGGTILGTPQPGKLGGLTGSVVKALATNGDQVHIRLSFASANGADKATWVTSKPSDATPTLVIQNLRNLDVLTKGTDGGFDDWTGPKATAEKLAWVPMYGGGPTTCANPVEATKYPSIYWACGNFTSMNLYAPQALCRWRYSPSVQNEPMEVYVR